MALDITTFTSLTERILGAAIEVHRTLGPGLLESIYARCLERELALRGLRFTTQQALRVTYKGVDLGTGYRLDLVVEDKVVVEIKCVLALEAVHTAQILTYMRLARCPIGLLINFNVARVMDGVRRVVNSNWEG
jgi:GxxExxY protein